MKISSTSGVPHVAANPAGTTGDGFREGSTFQGILLLLGSCLPVLGAVLLAPILPTLAAEFASTPGVGILVPLVLTAPALMVAVVSPFAGAIADKFGRKNALLVAMVFYAIFGVAPFFLDSLGAIVATRVVVGLCEGFIMTCCTTLIGDYYREKRRNTYLSTQTVVTTISAVIFLLIGGALGATSWRNTFWMYAISLVIGLLMLFALWEPVKSPTRNLRQAVPWRLITKPTLVTFFGGMIFYTLVVHLSFVLAFHGVTEVERIGMLAALASLATAVGAFSFRAMGRVGPQVSLTLAFGLAAVGFIIIWFAGGVGAVMAGAVIASAGTGLLLPTLITWSVGRLEQGVRGTGTGIWTGSLWIGQFICPLVIGALAAAAGGLAAAIGILGIAAAVMAVASPFIVGRQRALAPAVTSGTH